MKPLALALLLGIQLQAQPALKFETASVTRGRPDQGVKGGCHGTDSVFTPHQMESAPPLGQCVITDARLSHLLMIAFGFRWIEPLVGGPDWARNGGFRYNVEAKVPDPSSATEEQLLQLLQALVVDRFFVKYHREPGDLPGFAIVAAKDGPRLQESKAGKPYAIFNQSAPATLNAQKYSMAMLAALFWNIRNRPFVDETGLTSAYDFKLTWNEMDGPSLYPAIQEQLGLELVAKRVAVSLFVLESAEKPILTGF
jgi:uncharacterized protein (TIGR03435 family)